MILWQVSSQFWPCSLILALPSNVSDVGSPVCSSISALICALFVQHIARTYVCSRFIMQYYSYLFWGTIINGACTQTHRDRSFTQCYFSYSYISSRELFSKANKIPDSSGRYIFQPASWNNHCRLISCPWNSHLACVLKINKNISNQSLASDKFWLSLL